MVEKPPRLQVFSVGLDGRFKNEKPYTVWSVRWTVLADVHGEGLLLRPAADPIARVIALPDADQTPEQLAGLEEGLDSSAQFARRLAEAGCEVIIPVLIDRSSEFSGNPDLRTERPIMTNMPHREWLYRMSYEMGRHVIGYEIQKVLALVDWMTETYGEKTRIAVAGYGEGGLIALYSAAIDNRIASCLVSGYFGPRERVWEEPIYRNVWSLLREFGDAEIAGMILPRRVVIEYSASPAVSGPPQPAPSQKNVAAPGEINTPSPQAVLSEFNRLKTWDDRIFPERMSASLVPDNPQSSGVVLPGSNRALNLLLEPLTTRPPEL